MRAEDFAFKIKADFLGALAHPTRLKLIELMRREELPVGALCQRAQVAQSSVSKHLAILRQAGLVQTRQRGTTVFYSIQDRDIFKALRPVSAMLRKKLVESQKLLSHLGEAD